MHHYECIDHFGFPSGVRASDVLYHIPDYVNSPLALAICPRVQQHMDEHDYIRRLVALTNSEIKKRMWSHLVDFERLYVDLSKETSRVSINDVAQRIFNSTDALERCAVLRYLVQDQLRFIVYDNQLVGTIDQFTLRPSDVVGQLERTMRMVREQQAPFLAFLETAKHILATKTRHTFTEQELMFIQVVKEYALGSKTSANPFVLAAVGILKAMKRYGHIHRQSAADFLADVGVWRPWEDVGVLTSQVALEGQGNAMTDAQAAEMERLAYQSPHAVQDECASLRHDFGSLPVYTIDDADVAEVDDGLSLQVLDDDQVWIHVHVADPSSSLPASDGLAKIAADRLQNIYLPHRSYHMLPVAFTDRFSLHNATADGMNVLTISAKINVEDGGIVDYTIRPAKIRNVIPLSYDQLDAVMAWNISRPLVYQHPAPTEETPATLPPVDGHVLKDLLKIKQVSKRLTRSRVAKGLVVFDTLRPSVNVLPFPLPDTPPHVVRSLLPMTPPNIQVSLDTFNHSPARTLVAELMVLAGRIAAVWCHERQLPVPYRVQQSSNIPAKILQHVQHSKNKTTGLLGLMQYSALRVHLSPALMSTVRGQHFTMGIDADEGYIKVTSPLRRFVDLIAHWQIKAHLLGQKTPFDLAWLHERLPYMMHKEKRIARMQQSSMVFWALQLLHRYQHDIEKGERVRDVWASQVSHIPEGSGVFVTLDALGLHALLERSTTTHKLGDRLNVIVTNVLPQNAFLQVKPV
jgi:exoribonuclease R